MNLKGKIDNDADDKAMAVAEITGPSSGFPLHRIFLCGDSRSSFKIVSSVV